MKNKKISWLFVIVFMSGSMVMAQTGRTESGVLAWISERFSAWLGADKSPVNVISADCDKQTGENLVTCLQMQSALNYAVQSDPFLKKQYSEDPNLQRVFREDPTYRELLSQINLGTLFPADSGVREGYSVATHTGMVLAVYEAQKSLYGVQNFKSPTFVRNFDRFMKYLLTYHDIGKSISVKIDGTNSREIQYSYPIVWRLMLKSGFTDKESKLAISLIYLHKYIGDFLVGRLDLTSAIADIKKYAHFSETTTGDLFKILEIVFVTDAGSYPYLKEKVFMIDSNGKMIIKDQAKYQELRGSFIR